MSSNISALSHLFVKVYTAYDDAEFAEGRVPGSRPSILSQYDEEKKSAPKFSLGVFVFKWTVSYDHLIIIYLCQD